MLTFDGKVALGIGCGGQPDGIANGQAIAIAFARRGAKVVCVDRDEDALARTVEIIRREGFASDAHLADATRAEEVDAATGWLHLLTAVRQQTIIGGRIREMAILRIAVLNRASCEFEQHRPIAIREGVSDKEIEALRNGHFDAFDEKDAAALRLCDAITRDVHVPEIVFSDAARHFSARETVELCVTIASCNLVSRFLEAVAIDHEADDVAPPPGSDRDQTAARISR